MLLSDSAMDLSPLVSFARGCAYAVEASVAAGGAPHAALVGAAVTDALGLVFDCEAGSRKAANLRADGRVAFVFGSGDGRQTLQVGCVRPSSCLPLACYLCPSLVLPAVGLLPCILYFVF